MVYTIYLVFDIDQKRTIIDLCCGEKTSIFCLSAFVKAKASCLLVAKLKIKKNDMDRTANADNLKYLFLKYII